MTATNRRTAIVSATSLGLAAVLGCTSPTSENGNGNGEPAGPPTWKLVQQELPSALMSVQVVSNGDVYAVGADVEDGRGPYVLRYDGESWNRVETGASGDLWWVHEVGPDEIWMSGANRLVLRYQPSTGVFTQVDAGEGEEILYGIWGLHGGDIWAVGGRRCGVALRYDGSGWRQLELPELEGAVCVPNLFKVWGPAAEEVWMVGERGVTIAFDGTGLALQQTESGRTLFTVHGDPEGELITAVGGQFSGEIRELVNGVWTEVTPERTRQMLGVNVGADGQAVAVGDGASSIRRGSDGWVVEENGLLDAVGDLAFHSVWSDPDGNAWAVGGQLLIGPFDRGMVAFYGPRTPSSEIVNGR